MNDNELTFGQTIILAFIAGMIVLVVSGFSVWLININEVRKCESLQKQEVKAVISEGMFAKKCIVLQRDLVVH